jgi:hypothetical protein
MAGVMPAVLQMAPAPVTSAALPELQREAHNFLKYGDEYYRCWMRSLKQPHSNTNSCNHAGIPDEPRAANVGNSLGEPRHDRPNWNRDEILSVSVVLDNRH